MYESSIRTLTKRFLAATKRAQQTFHIINSLWCRDFANAILEILTALIRI